MQNATEFDDVSKGEKKNPKQNLKKKLERK